MNNIQARAFKILPRMLLLGGIGIGIYNWQKFSLARSPMNLFVPTKIACMSFIPTKEHPINNLVKNVIKIADNGAVVGYGYCFSENCIVSMRYINIYGEVWTYSMRLRKMAQNSRKPSSSIKTNNKLLVIGRSLGSLRACLSSKLIKYFLELSREV